MEGEGHSRRVSGGTAGGAQWGGGWNGQSRTSSIRMASAELHVMVMSTSMLVIGQMMRLPKVGLVCSPSVKVSVPSSERMLL